MSLRQRLALSVTLLCLTLLSWSEAAIYLGARRTLLSQLDQALLAVTGTEVASAIDGPRLHLHESLLPGAGYQRYAVILRPGGPVLAQSEGIEGSWPRLARLEATRHPLLTDLEWQGHALRAVYFPLAGQDAVAVVALPRAPVERALGSLLTVLAFVLVVGGGLSTALSWWLACRLTRPLEELARAAHQLGPTRLDRRLETRFEEDRELVLLREALNGMLAQLEQAFVNQRRFLSDASHELRTPLTNLTGHLEVTLRHPRSPEQYAACLQRALGEARRLARLVRDLLTLAQADEGRSLAHPVTLSLHDLLRCSCEGFALVAREREVLLELECPPDLLVLADPDCLRQVLDNLLDNALRHAPPATAVRVTTAETGREVEVKVCDSGPGLTVDEQARLFERFARGDPSRSRGTGGTGLGLAIVRQLMAAQDGTVEVESAPGEGACFVLRLPRVNRPARDGLPAEGRAETNPARSPG